MVGATTVTKCISYNIWSRSSENPPGSKLGRQSAVLHPRTETLATLSKGLSHFSTVQSTVVVVLEEAVVEAAAKAVAAVVASGKVNPNRPCRILSSGTFVCSCLRYRRKLVKSLRTRHALEPPWGQSLEQRNPQRHQAYAVSRPG